MNYIERCEKNKKEENKIEKKRKEKLKKINEKYTHSPENIKYIPKDLQKLFKVEQTAFKYTFINYGALNVPSNKSQIDYLNEMLEPTKKLLINKLNYFQGIKYNVAIKLNLSKM